MKATLTPANPEPVKKHNITVDGVVIGYVTQNEQGTHHVVIDAGPAEGNGLYQGHGDTYKLAILQLIDRHQGYAEAQLRRIKELKKVLL